MIALIEVADATAEIPLPVRDGLSVRWLHRDGVPAGDPVLLEQAAREVELPPNEGYVWAGRGIRRGQRPCGA